MDELTLNSLEAEAEAVALELMADTGRPDTDVKALLVEAFRRGERIGSGFSAELEAQDAELEAWDAAMLAQQQIEDRDVAGVEQEVGADQ